MNTAQLSKLKHLLRLEVRSYVIAYLMARAYAETVEAQVEPVHRAILEECPVYADRADGRQILKADDLYLCSNEAHCRDFYDEADHRLRKLGLKPATMPKEHCPVLVAKHELTKIEWKLIDASGQGFGVNSSNILNHGLEDRQKWIDLVVGLHVNQPDFVNPITGKKPQ